MYKDIHIEKKYSSFYGELRDEKKVYTTYLDIFKNAAIIGCLLNNEVFVDGNVDGDGRKRIPQSAIINDKDEFNCIINVITFIHFSRIGENKILEKVFLDSEDIIRLKQNIAENYARGGIEKLYNIIMTNAKTNEDLMDNIMNFISGHEEIIDFNEDLGSMEDIIRKFM